MRPLGTYAVVANEGTGVGVARAYLCEEVSTEVARVYNTTHGTQ